MLLRILQGKGIFYPGELVSMNDETALQMIHGGYAEEQEYERLMIEGSETDD